LHGQSCYLWLRLRTKQIIDMIRIYQLPKRRFFVIAAVFCCMFLRPQSMFAECCCQVCPDGLTYPSDPLPETDPACLGGCDPSQCPECQTAIPLTDHLWILAVLGAAGGAWLLLRNRTAEEIA
jgi:hypothetical protein